MNKTHSCYGLPGRNSLYQYPQLLPNGLTDHISSESVTEVFSILRTSNSSVDEACQSALRHATCILSSPPCANNTGLLLPVCTDSCLAYTRVLEEGGCDGVFGNLVQSADSQFGDLFDLLFQFDCTNMSSYLFYDNPEMRVDSSHCTDLLPAAEKGEYVIWIKN